MNAKRQTLARRLGAFFLFALRFGRAARLPLFAGSHTRRSHQPPPRAARPILFAAKRWWSDPGNRATAGDIADAVGGALILAGTFVCLLGLWALAG